MWTKKEMPIEELKAMLQELGGPDILKKDEGLRKRLAGTPGLPRDIERDIEESADILRISKPVLYLSDPNVRSADHLSLIASTKGNGDVLVMGHVIRYGTKCPSLKISIAHELSHAKTEESGFFCFPPLEGEAEEDFLRSWNEIDEFYAHSTMGRYWREGLTRYFKRDVPSTAEYIAGFVPRLGRMPPEKAFSILIYELHRTTLNEAVVRKLQLAEFEDDVEATECAWEAALESTPRLLKYREQFKRVLLGLPAQEELTKERYIDSGLELIFSEYIANQKTAIPHDEYRRQVSQAVKRIKAEI